MTDDADRKAPGDPLPPTDSAVWDAGLAAAFGEDDADSSPSVLERLERIAGRDPRVHLRDAPALPGGPTVRPTNLEKNPAGRYRILGEIARGGVGVILKGRDVDLGRDLAMKVLRDDHAGNTELVQRFVEEAQIGGQLQHPGIVPVYELGIDEEQRPYFTMKLIQGETLARLLEERSGPDDDRIRFLRIFEQVCDAMAYAHARGVVHRDLKPANILVGSFGEVQVVDWGFAKVLARGGVADEESAHVDRRDASLIATVRSGPTGMESQVGSVMGTPSYMPPEQAQGRVDALDERTDVFALGAILCEIVTGQPPYVGETLVQTALKAQRAELGDAYARLEACDADAPVVELARACLSEDPAQRPRHAGRLAKAVATYLESLEQRAHDALVEAARAKERAAAERRTRRLQAVFGTCAAAVVALGLGAFLWVRSSEQDRVRRIEDEIHGALLEAEKATGQERHEDAAIALERARTLSAAPGVDVDLVTRVEKTVRTTERERSDARLMAALEAVRATDDAIPVASDVDSEAYGRLFAEHGLDITKATPEDVARRTGFKTDFSRIVAAALDDWVFRIGVPPAAAAGEEARLLAIASHIDPDPWRDDLRQAALSNDADRLLALAAELDPKKEQPLALDTLALALRSVGRGYAAVAVLRKAVRTYPGDFHLQLHLAMDLARFSDDGLGEAAEHARTAIALRPDAIGPRLFLFRYSVLHKDFEAATACLEDVEERDASGFRTRVLRALLATAQGDHKGALAALEEAIVSGDTSPPIHFFRAVVLLRMGETERACEALRTFVETEPSGDITGGPRMRGGGPGPRGRGPRGARVGLTAPMDTNHDGCIAPDEAPQAVRPLFPVLDRDGDGRLSGHELRLLFRLVRELSDENPEKSGTRTDGDRDQG